MPLQDSVKSLMSSRVISVLPDTLILVAIDIILTNNFNGLPVTDKNGVLVGILTKYDLITKRGYIHDDTKASEVMNTDPLFLSDNMTVEDAVTAFAEHHRVDPIPVVNSDKKVVGIISRYDMVKLFKEFGISPQVNRVPSSQTNNSNIEKSPAVPSGNNLVWILFGLAALATAGVLVYYFFF